MKKLLLTIVLLSAGFWNGAYADNTDVSNIENVVYITPFSASPGTEITLSIKMKNTAAIRGFQFNLFLPEGMTAVKSDKGRIQGALNPSRLPDEDEHDLTFSEQPNGSILFLCSSQYPETFTGTDGEIATLRVNVDANMEEGDYSIRLEDITLTESDISKFYQTNLVETTVTIVASAQTRVELDENATSAPDDAEGVDVLVKRSIVAGVWNTLCLPFSMTEAQVTTAFGTGVRIAEFTDWEVDGDNVKLTFTEGATTIEKNVPYLIRVAEGLTDFTVDGVDLAPERNSKGKLVDPYVEVKVGRKYGYFTGTYTVADLPVNSLFLNNDRLWFCTGSNTTKAFRGYFELDDVAYSAEARLSMTVDSKATGITETNNRNYQDKGTYDLQGRKVNSKQKGVYIESGKKIVVK
ncbi:MAG: hypothetical protein J5552_09900 [Prevotella sp.]|nr:hypothetical protein [Prevotella sp.]